MIRARSLALDVRYNNAPFAGQVGGEIESLIPCIAIPAV